MSGYSELDAMKTVADALEGLEDDPSRARVLAWATAKYGRELPVQIRGSTITPIETASKREFTDFPSLFDATQPKNNQERALVAGYWFQTVQGQADLDSQSINTALKHMGQGIGNITMSLSDLINQKPALVLQVKKSGKTKQARKKYRLTTAGIQTVERMLAQPAAENEQE